MFKLKILFSHIQISQLVHNSRVLGDSSIDLGVPKRFTEMKINTFMIIELKLALGNKTAKVGKIHKIYK